MKKKLTSLIIWIFASHANAGGMTGNGGDTVLQEFNLRGLQLAAYFKAEPKVPVVFGIDATKFLDVVKKTKLESKDQLFLLGNEVDAINYPSELRIEVSRSRWLQTTTRLDVYFIQRRIALHEYLWVYGINDEKYVISNPIIMELEKQVGQLLDPSTRLILLKRFCDKVDNDDFVGAENLLSWSLDLNDNCSSQGQSFTPFERILFSYLRKVKSDPIESERLKLIKSMLEHGANPNQIGWSIYPVIINVLWEDLDFAQLLLEFGADPNLLDSHGDSVFSTAAGMAGRGFRMNPGVFMMFFKAGGDVNLSADNFNRSPARVVVSKEDNSDVVETLIQTGKVDWCNSLDPVFKSRTIDVVRKEYQPLLTKYNVVCGRFATVSGEGKTCTLAQEDGRLQCLNKGFKKATFDPYPSPEQCGSRRQAGKPDDEFWAMFHCTDE